MLPNSSDPSIAFNKARKLNFGRFRSLTFNSNLQKNSSRFSSKVESHYIEFNPSQPAWKFFDVSSCMRDLEKLYLKLTLDGKRTITLD